MRSGLRVMSGMPGNEAEDQSADDHDDRVGGSESSGEKSEDDDKKQEKKKDEFDLSDFTHAYFEDSWVGMAWTYGRL